MNLRNNLKKAAATVIESIPQHLLQTLVETTRLEVAVKTAATTLLLSSHTPQIDSAIIMLLIARMKNTEV